MLEISETSLVKRLRQAEEAEGDVHRMQSLAAEAPQLRVDKAKQDLQGERARERQSYVDLARKEIETAMEMQTRVPALVEQAVAVAGEITTLECLFCRLAQLLFGCAQSAAVDEDTAEPGPTACSASVVA